MEDWLAGTAALVGIAPNWILLAAVGPAPTAPPFALKFGALFELIVKDGVRSWPALLPLTAIGLETDGTAGMVGVLPFIGERLSADGGAPTAVDMVVCSDAFGGKVPLVADAYDDRP